MDTRGQFWLVRARPGALEVPILKEDVAETFREKGWEVVPLPLVYLMMGVREASRLER